MNFKIIIGLMFTTSIVACNNGNETSENGGDSPAEQIKELEPKLMNDSTYAINYEVAKQLIPAYLKFREAHPDDPKSPDYLYKAGEINQGMGQGNMAVKYFDEFCKKYPDNKRAAVSLFQQAFVYETLLKNKEMAVKLYKEFIEKYPNHELVPSAKASIDNIDKSPEELIKEFHAKEQEKKK